MAHVLLVIVAVYCEVFRSKQADPERSWVAGSFGPKPPRVVLSLRQKPSTYG